MKIYGFNMINTGKFEDGKECKTCLFYEKEKALNRVYKRYVEAFAYWLVADVLVDELNEALTKEEFSKEMFDNGYVEIKGYYSHIRFEMFETSIAKESYLAPDWKQRERVRRLKLMHELMCTANDENLYMEWVCVGIPDAPTDDDFEFIAEDDELFDDTVDLFGKCISDYGWR